jgi:hypothetical protein
VTVRRGVARTLVDGARSGVARVAAAGAVRVAAAGALAGIAAAAIPRLTAGAATIVVAECALLVAVAVAIRQVAVATRPSGPSRRAWAHRRAPARALFGRRRPSASRRLGEEGTVPELERLERLVLGATLVAGEAYHRLRPALRRIAAEELSSRRGIDLDGRGGAARAVLGEVPWALLRPDLPPPVDRRGPGLDPAALRAVVDTLEAL